MLERIKRLLRKAYMGAQKNAISLRFLLLLKEIGLPRKVNYWLTCIENRNLRKEPSEELLDSRKFYEENRARVSAVSDLLADEMSKKVWKRVLQYRTMRTPLPRELCQEKTQYFVDDIIRVEDGEVFIDAGAYVGDTIKPLLAQAKKRKARIKRVVAFEPDELNYQFLRHDYGQNPAITLIQKGVSDRNGTGFFSGTGINGRLTDGHAGQDGAPVSVAKIDDVPECRDATWIKMDIEGAEMQALAGAKETILRNHPKLTICIYHSDEDMLRIPEYVHAIAPEYKLYIRHHTRMKNETVLYAIL